MVEGATRSSKCANDLRVIEYQHQILEDCFYSDFFVKLNEWPLFDFQSFTINPSGSNSQIEQHAGLL